MISEAMSGLNQARAQLALEAEASSLNQTFQQLYAAYSLYSSESIATVRKPAYGSSEHRVDRRTGCADALG